MVLMVPMMTIRRCPVYSYVISLKYSSSIQRTSYSYTYPNQNDEEGEGSPTQLCKKKSLGKVIRVAYCATFSFIATKRN